MFIALFFLLLIAACTLGLVRDQGGMSLLALVGFTQDPIRKVIAGEPVMMTVMVGLVVGCMALRRVMNPSSNLLEPFYGWSRNIATPLNIYLCILLMQGAHSFIRYGSLILTGLGAVFYLAPLVAIIVGYFQFNNFKLVSHFLFIFCGLSFVVCLSVLASYYGIKSDFFGEVGSGLIIYDQGTILKAYSGLMRSSEIASWHMGVAVCFVIILVFDRATPFRYALAIIIVMLFFAAIILTGRRKMLLQIVIFSSLYFPVLRYYQGRFSARFLSAALIAVVLMSSIYWLFPSFEGTQYDLYLARGASVFGDAGERFTTLGLGSIGWAYNQYGFLGGGLGVAAQGSQHFVQGIVGGASEGGIGKLVSELGLISLVVLAWLSIVFAKHLHKCLKMVADLAPEKLLFSVGVLVFLVSNLPTFIVASQVYGDVFVLIVLGLLAGSLFGLPRQVSRHFEE